nr:hypothetical protein [Salinibacter altiplanensis]
MPIRGVVGAVDAVSVELSGPYVRDVAVPDGAGVLRQLERDRRLPVVGVLKQQQLNPVGVGTVQGKVNADAVPRRSSWVGPAGLDMTIIPVLRIRIDR